MSRIWRQHLTATTGLYSDVVCGPLIGGLISAGLAAFNISSSSFIGTLLTGIATTAITIGLQYLLTPKPPKPADGKSPKVQAVPPIIFGVGTNRISGAYMLWEEYAGALYSVVALAGHRISAISRIYFADDYITAGVGDYFGDYGLVPTATHINDGRYVPDVMRLGLRLGVVPETAYPFITSALSASGIWTAAHRGDGIASLGMVCRSPGYSEFPKRFPSGVPQPSVVAEMAMVWDFRDPAQSPDDPKTWTFSKNAILALAWYLCFCPYGPRLPWTRAILPYLSRWQEEADICDEAVPLAVGGTERRYEVNGWATSETDPVAVLNSLLAASDCHLVEMGDGGLVPTVGKFREELVETVTDADLLSWDVQHDVPEEDEINRLVPRITYPATDYTAAVCDYFESTADQLKAGRVLAQENDLQWVQQWRQGRRLTKRTWSRLQTKKSGALMLRLSAINAARARWIRLDTPLSLPKLNRETIENRRAFLSLSRGGLSMEWQLHPANLEEWVPASDEGSAPPVPSAPTSAGIPEPTVDTLVGVADVGTVYLRAAVFDPQRSDLTPVMRWRVTNTGDGTPGAWNESRSPNPTIAAGLIVVNSGAVPTNVLDVQLAYIGAAGSYGPWTPILTVASPSMLEGLNWDDGTPMAWDDSIMVAW